MIDVKVTVDTSAFDKTFAEYMQFNKRQPAEIVNAKLYFIALNALSTTKNVDGGKIRAEMNQPSKNNPKVTLGELLTIINLKKRNKMPKKSSTYNKNIANNIEKFIKNRISHINFLRSGWLPAIKKLDFWNRKGDINFSKRFAPKKPAGIKQIGKDKGDVFPAKLEQAIARGTIINSVGISGKAATPTVQPILQAGLDAAIQKEVASMKIYIEKKYQQQHDKMKRKAESGVI